VVKLEKKSLINLTILLLLFCFSLLFLTPIPVKATGLSAYGVEWVADDTRFQPTTYPESYYVECVNTTFFVYMRNDSGSYKFYIKSYNHTTETMSSETYIDTSASIDRHNAPSIGNLPNGSLIIFYDTHSYVPGYISYRVSNGAWNINSWHSEQHETGDFTYPNPCVFDDKLVLFLRESQADMESVIWYRYNFNNTHFWQDKTQITLDYGSPDIGKGGWYAAFNKIGSNIYVSAHLANATVPECVDLYFAYSMDKGVSWKKADDSALSLPLGENAKILDVPDQTVYTFPNINHDGNPVISYTRRDSTAAPFTAFHWLGLAFWNGAVWQYNNLTNQDMQLLNFSYATSVEAAPGIIVYPFLDPAFQRLTFWAPSVGDEMLSRYVQTDSPFVFAQVLETDMAATGGGKFMGVRNAIIPYEAFVSCITDEGGETAYFVYNRATYLYTFKGKYDEETGELESPNKRDVIVTVHYTDMEDEHFTLNGTYWYGSAYQPLYFSYDTVDREYWLYSTEIVATIKVFSVPVESIDTTLIFILGDEYVNYVYVTLGRFINGSVETLEKRYMPRKTAKILIINNTLYYLSISNGGTYDFGEIELYAPEMIFKLGTVIMPPLFIIGMVGIFAMIVGPTYAAILIKKGEYYEGARIGLVVTVVGMAFVIVMLGL